MDTRSTSRRSSSARVMLALLLGAIAMLSASGGAIVPAEAQAPVPIGTSGPRDSMCYYIDPADGSVKEATCPCELKVVQSHEITDDDGNLVSNPVGFDDAISLNQAKLIIEGGAIYPSTASVCSVHLELLVVILSGIRVLIGGSYDIRPASSGGQARIRLSPTTASTAALWL